MHCTATAREAKTATVRGAGKIAMPRKKLPVGLIPNRRMRVNTFGKRKEGLKKKASELSVLCGVEVALVVAPPADGAGAGAAADLWESKEGVLARYRDLGPEVRARHTLREYLYAELGKEEAKLARVRQAGPDGLDCWDRALDDVDTVEEARKLLEAIDAAIQAADDRRRALGMPVDDDDDGEEEYGGAGSVLEGIAPLSSAHVDDGYLLHALGGAGGNDQQAMAAVWGNVNGFHPCSAAGMQYGFQQFNSSNLAMAGGYDLQMVPDMYNNGGVANDAYHHYQTRHAGATQDGCYGFPSASYFGLPSGYQMQQVAAAQPNLAMASADEPCHAMMPAPREYPSADSRLNYMDTQATHGVHGGSGGTSSSMDARGNFINAMSSGDGGGGNFISAPPAAPSHAMGGTSDNFTPAQPLAMSYGGDMTTAGRDVTQSAMEQLHCLGDLEDTPPNQWGN